MLWGVNMLWPHSGMGQRGGEEPCQGNMMQPAASRADAVGQPGCTLCWHILGPLLRGGGRSARGGALPHIPPPSGPKAPLAISPHLFPLQGRRSWGSHHQEASPLHQCPLSAPYPAKPLQSPSWDWWADDTQGQDGGGEETQASALWPGARPGCPAPL